MNPAPAPAGDGPRIVIVGTSGAGKSHLAARLAHELGCPRIELDALHWAPNWVERPDADMAADLARAITPARWVADGNYSSVRHVLWPRATDIVWLDHPRHVVWARVLRRTARRTLLREPLWHGNRETLRMALFSRESILWWSLTTFAGKRRRYAAMMASGEFPHLRWHRLGHPREVGPWIAALHTRLRIELQAAAAATPPAPASAS